MPQQITILGATGSIGRSALDVISLHRDQFQTWGLSAHSSAKQLAELATSSGAKFLSIGSGHAAELNLALYGAAPKIPIHEGREGLNYLAGMPESEIVITGIVGAAGLLPTLTAVRAGKKVLIANKEPLVMMGPEIMREAEMAGATIVPLDSEHNAILQCLPAKFQEESTTCSNAAGVDQLQKYGITKIILTASGGPFRQTSRKALESVTPEQAASHPNWKMGRKISIDSATMMNKGLELIEACALFSVDPSQVEIVIHPQSIVHSLVEYNDGSFLAQMANPDMRIAIANALGYPDHISSGAEKLNIGELGTLEFGVPDEERFPCLKLARLAADAGGTAPTILNAANEVAVEAFCNRLIKFTDIPKIIDQALDKLPVERERNLETVILSDSNARRFAYKLVSEQRNTS